MPPQALPGALAHCRHLDVVHGSARWQLFLVLFVGVLGRELLIFFSLISLNSHMSVSWSPPNLAQRPSRALIHALIGGAQSIHGSWARRAAL